MKILFKYTKNNNNTAKMIKKLLLVLDSLRTMNGKPVVIDAISQPSKWLGNNYKSSEICLLPMWQRCWEYKFRTCSRHSERNCFRAYARANVFFHCYRTVIVSWTPLEQYNAIENGGLKGKRWHCCCYFCFSGGCVWLYRACFRF